MNRSHFHLRRLPLIAVLLVVISVAIASCTGNSPADAALQRAELLIDSVPAEGMAALDSIPTDHLTTPRSRALYDLLHTRAAHRLHLNPAADSAMDASVSYFEQAGSGEAHHLKMACFYSAVAHYYAGNYPAALRRALRCIDVASDLSDNYYLAKAHELIADIYRHLYNTTNTILHTRKAAFYYKQAGYPANEYWALYYTVNALHVAQRYDEAVALADSLIRISDGDTTFQETCKAHKAVSLAYSGHIEEAEKILTAINLEQFWNEEAAKYSAAVRIYLSRNDLQAAEEALDSAVQICGDELNNNLMMMRLELASRKGNYKEALDYMTERYVTDDSIMRELVNQSTLSAQTDYFNDKTKSIEAEAARLRTNMIGAIIILLILAAAIVMFINSRRIKMSANKERALSMYYNERTLRQRAEEHKNQSGKLANEIFRAQLRRLDKICSDYFVNSKDDDAGCSFHKDASAVIAEITSEESVAELQATLDRIYDGILSRIQEQITSLNDSEKLLLTYILAGFSVKSICLFLGLKNSSFYMRKHRIIKKIASSSSPDKDEFLMFLQEKQ